MGKLAIVGAMFSILVAGACGQRPHTSVRSSPPSTSDREFKIKIVDHDGQPLPYAKISCDYRGKPFDIADADGEYSCLIPSNQKYVFLLVEARGVYFQDRFTFTEGVHVIKLESKSRNTRLLQTGARELLLFFLPE